MNQPQLSGKLSPDSVLQWGAWPRGILTPGVWYRLSAPLHPHCHHLCLGHQQLLARFIQHPASSLTLLLCPPSKPHYREDILQNKLDHVTLLLKLFNSFSFSFTIKQQTLSMAWRALHHLAPVDPSSSKCPLSLAHETLGTYAFFLFRPKDLYTCISPCLDLFPPKIDSSLGLNITL